MIRRNSKTEQYSAVIVKMYPLGKEAILTLCTLCSGTLKNQPIVGMEVLTGLKMLSPNEEFWTRYLGKPYDGYAYNPKRVLSKIGKMFKHQYKKNLAIILSEI